MDYLQLESSRIISSIIESLAIYVANGLETLLESIFVQASHTHFQHRHNILIGYWFREPLIQ